MICNLKKNYMFVHIQKTAGSSIETVLLSDSGSYSLGNRHTLLKNIQLNDFELKTYKFAFVRNPWERLVSWYNMIMLVPGTNHFYEYIRKNSKNFSDFLNCTDVVIDSITMINQNIPEYKSISFNQLDYLSDPAGNILVDFIGRFENIENDFETLAKKLELNTFKMPHHNKIPHENYKAYYKDDRDIEKVQKMYQRDIEYFKYSF